MKRRFFFKSVAALLGLSAIPFKTPDKPSYGFDRRWVFLGRRSKATDLRPIRPAHEEFIKAFMSCSMQYRIPIGPIEKANK